MEPTVKTWKGEIYCDTCQHCLYQVSRSTSKDANEAIGQWLVHIGPIICPTGRPTTIGIKIYEL